MLWDHCQLCVIQYSDLTYWCQCDELIVTAVNRWECSERKSWDLSIESREFLCLPPLGPTVIWRALAITNNRCLTMLWNYFLKYFKPESLGSKKFQDATGFVFNNLFLKRPFSVTEHFVLYGLFNHFLVTFYTPVQTVLSGRKCQSFLVDTACSCELLRIWGYAMCVPDQPGSFQHEEFTCPLHCEDKHTAAFGDSTAFCHCKMAETTACLLLPGVGTLRLMQPPI